MIKMTLADAAAILNVQAPTQNTPFEGISRDTRNIKPGNLYLAIKGENFDGNDYTADAQKKGAVGAIVSKQTNATIPQLQVEDTIQALGKLAVNWRNRFTLPLIGVTGSNGKTTLKNMIASILRAASQGDASKVLATEGNLNNDIGVPLNLIRLNENHQYGVIEMGMNHFGEIEYLTKMTKPCVAVINNAAEGHLAGVKDIAGVGRAKGEIFLGLTPDGTAVLNRDDSQYDYWISLTKQFNLITFGLDQPADVTASIADQQPNETQQIITLHTPKGDMQVTLPLLGLHNVRNALAATASALAINLDLNTIKKGLETVTAAPGRMNHHLLANGARIIDDTYNANPFSTRAAINTLSQYEGTRILVLGDMRELGPEERAMHTATGQHARDAGIDMVFTYGDLTAETAKAFGQNAHHFTDRETLIAALKPHIKKGVTVLVKGSHSMKMEIVVAGLMPEQQAVQTH